MLFATVCIQYHSDTRGGHNKRWFWLFDGQGDFWNAGSHGISFFLYPAFVHQVLTYATGHDEASGWAHQQYQYFHARCEHYHVKYSRAAPIYHQSIKVVHSQGHVTKAKWLRWQHRKHMWQAYRLKAINGEKAVCHTESTGGKFPLCIQDIFLQRKLTHSTYRHHRRTLLLNGTTWSSICPRNWS